MASHTATPVGNPDTLNDSSGSENPQVQPQSVCSADENAVATDSILAEQDPDLYARQAESTPEVATASESGQDENWPEALDTSTSATDYSPEVDGVDASSTPSESDEEPNSSTDQADEIFYQDDNASSRQTVIGKVHTHQNISYHTSQILDEYFTNNDVISNVMDSLVEDWANLERLASEDELWQLLESGTVNSQAAHQSSQQSPLSQVQDLNEATQRNATDDWEDGQSLQHTENYFEQGHQSATYSPTCQQSDDLYDDEDVLQPKSYLPAGQQQSEHYYVQDHQAAACSPGSQQNEELLYDENDDQRTFRIPTVQLSDELYDNEDDLQPRSHLLESQQGSDHYDEESLQPVNYSSGSQQYDDEVYYDETDFQQASYIPEDQRYSQFYSEQDSSHVLTEHQHQTHSESYHQQTFEEESFIPGDDTSNTGFNTDDLTSFFDNNDDDATVDEDEPEIPSLSIDERMAELRKEIALTQSSTQATLDKISENEKRIQEIGATLKQKRKRADKVDESEEMPVKKTKTPAYRRPSTRREPKAKASKGTKKSRTIGSPIEFIEYVPEGQVQNDKSSDDTGFLQGLGFQFFPPAPQVQNSYSSDALGHAQATGSQIEWVDQPAPQIQNSYQLDSPSHSHSAGSQFESFDESSPQVQNAYQPDTPSYVQHVRRHYNESSPVITQTQPANTPNAPSYTKAQDFQGQDFGALLNELGHQQYPTGNYGIHAAQAMAANGYPQFPFGIPTNGSLRWNGY
ncbi:hypothetical protein DL98DRAFT_650871 [Cadophora sp. DSE1049]|nr:hypothetical protein DL98DRAFT_650871 [Cadophora sp. DSE1049]